MEEGDLSLHDALLSDETQATPKYSQTLYFRYCLLVATVLLVAGLIPFGLLSVLEEFQTSPPSLSAGPADDHHHHDPLPPPTTTYASPPSPSTVQVRPDLPERALTDYVNTLIGTSGYGHAFAGATIPFGMAKPVADIYEPWRNQAGFISNGHVIQGGMSQMHDEGTGAQASLGNFPIWIDYCNDTTWDTCPLNMGMNDKWLGKAPNAKVGSFGLEISTGYSVEMTASRRTSLFRIVSSNGSVAVPVLRVGLTDLFETAQEASAQVVNGSRVIGNGTFLPSFGQGNYNLHFCTDINSSVSRIIDHAFVNWTFPDLLLHHVDDMTLARDGSDPIKYSAVLLRFTSLLPETPILVRMGMSFISTSQACSNAEGEMPNWSFEDVSQSAVAQFESILNRIRVDPTGVSEETLTLFYSSLYRTLISPQNYTDENPLWNTTEPTFDSFYCIWDTFRFTHPLFNILVPETQSQMIRSLIDIYRHEGWLPDCRMSFCKGITQSGSNADILLTDAYLKGIQNVPWNDAFAAILNDAEIQSENWGYQGRGNINEYNTLGYVPVDAEMEGGPNITHRTVSRSIEYNYDDFSIALFARKTHNRTLYEKYISRSQNWRNLWMADLKEPKTNITGFFQAKTRDGNWSVPLGRCNETGCVVGQRGSDPEFYEESAWSYSWFVPHDYAALVELVGGRDKFVDRLDTFFDKGFANLGNEPGLLEAVLYHYVGRPAKSAARTRKLIRNRFGIGTFGLPGNDDGGSLGAWLVWVMSGVVPIAGQSVYLILPPYFPEIQFMVTNSRIVVHNFGDENQFIQSVMVNGVNWTNNWISHDFFSNGQTMEMWMGNQESTWGTGINDVPPSWSTGGFGYDDV